MSRNTGKKLTRSWRKEYQRLTLGPLWVRIKRKRVMFGTSQGKDHTHQWEAEIGTSPIKVTCVVCGKKSVLKWKRIP